MELFYLYLLASHSSRFLLLIILTDPDAQGHHILPSLHYRVSVLGSNISQHRVFCFAEHSILSGTIPLDVMHFLLEETNNTQ
jgi:hypothetical protein